MSKSRFDAFGQSSGKFSSSENILGKPLEFNALEKIVYGNSEFWFYLKEIQFDQVKETVEITVYPNNDENDIRKFRFYGVPELLYESDEEQEPEYFPQQIFGLDLKERLNTKSIVIIGCDEAEYIFKTDRLPENVE